MDLEPCPPAEELAELVDGALAQADAKQVHHHVRGCLRCRMVLAGLGAGAEELELEPEPAPLILKAGALVSRFRLERMLGRGGMGAVWAASDPELGREVALKILFAGVGSEGDSKAGRARLLREAKAMARLSHPNVVPVFEIGEVQGRLFLVMELVEGETLAQWLKAPRPFAQVLDKFLGAGAGLAAAHAAGVIHRDFKPENVLVGKDGRARVTDFGLARGHLASDADPSAQRTQEGALPETSAEKLEMQVIQGSLQARLALAEAEAATLHPDAGPFTPEQPTLPVAMRAAPSDTLPSVLTPTGALLGTPAYMSPEQMRGQRADARSDLFAYCTTLFEALCGVRPFPAKTLAATRAKIEANAIEWPRGSGARQVPRWLRRELAIGLRAEPAERHGSMEELLEVLRRERAREGQRFSWLGPLVALALILLAAIFAAARRPGPGGARSVAVLAPRNESARADASWIAPVLAELVAGDLGGDARVRLVPAADVSAALSDLELQGTAPGEAEVARLRTRLGADAIVGGSYTIDAAGRLSSELSLWEPKGGAVRFTETGDQAHLIDLGARLGRDVRRGLGMQAAAAPGGEAFPANLEAARHYAQGLQLVRAYQPNAAIEELKVAEKLAPENARIQLALARAYSSQRVEAPMRKAITLAYQAKNSLPPDEQLDAEILYNHAKGDDAKALALAEARHRAHPLDLRYGIELGDTYALANRYKDALALSAELHKLPPPDGADARIDLLEELSCQQLNDFSCAVAAGERAFASASARRARWQMGTARYREGVALRKLGQVERAIAALAESERLYAEVGDKGGKAGSSIMLATIAADRGDFPAAKAAFELALASFVEIGDRAAEAAAMHNLAVLSRRARDLPAALNYANRAIALDLELGLEAQAANTMQVLGNLRIDMGDLSAGIETLTGVCELRRKAKSPQLLASLLALATALLQQADFAKVHALLDEASHVETQEKVVLARMHFLTAGLAISEHRLADVIREGMLAAGLFKESALSDEQATSLSLVARAQLERNELAAARASLDPALALIAASKGKMSRTPVLISDAMLRAKEDPARLQESIKALRQLQSELSQAGAQSDSWQVRTALTDLLAQTHQPGARSALTSLRDDARAQGLLLYAQAADEELKKLR